MVDIRESLKKSVEESGLKRKVIAERAEMSPTKLSMILNKRRRIEVSDLIALCLAIGTSPEELVGDIAHEYQIRSEGKS